MGGIAVMGLGLGYGTNPADQPLFARVRSLQERGQVYLLPVRIPPVWKGSGAASTNFTVPPRPGTGDPGSTYATNF